MRSSLRTARQFLEGQRFAVIALRPTGGSPPTVVTASVFKTDPARRGWLELPNGGLCFLGDRVTIGRQAGNQLVLPDATLSRQHAIIVRTAAGYELSDLQSRNGTQLGGKPLARPSTLRDGDRIQLGAVELRFRCTRRLEPRAPEGGSPQTTQVLGESERSEGWLALIAVDAGRREGPAIEGEAPPGWPDWIAGVRGAVEQHAGRVSVYLDDAVLAQWPAASAGLADILGALRALEAWRADSPRPFRVFVHQGTVLSCHTPDGVTPDGRDLMFLLSLQKLALDARTVFSVPAVRSLGLEARTESLGRFSVDDMIGAHELFGALEQAPVSPAPEPGAASRPDLPGRAAFLSYASQDAAIARRLSAVLREAGVEVWLDQSELRGGDSWDEKIRRQIKACALFVPLISASTQARREGYFRIEWKLAAQRTHAMADGTPFLLPVVVDATPEADALVPPEFRSVHWTQLQHADAFAAFARRVRTLLDKGAA